MRHAVLLLVCLAACRVEADWAETAFRCDDERCPPGYTCVADTCTPSGAADGGDIVDTRLCGDGVLRDGVEECDDENLIDGDTCSSRCLRCDQGDAQLTWAGNGHCYTAHRDLALPWAGAEVTCESLGGHLVTYGSVDEEVAVRPLLADAEAWFGLHDRYDEGVYEWITNEPVEYFGWSDGQPAPETAESEDCGQHDASSEWSDRACDDTLPYLCEQDGWTIRSQDQHAYRVFYQARTQDEAALACATRSAHLATITDASEQAFVGALVTETAVWIGLVDPEGDGEFAWITGEPFDFADWYNGEPDGLVPPARCGFMNLYGDETWLDDSCAVERAYLCESD